MDEIDGPLVGGLVVLAAIAISEYRRATPAKETVPCDSAA